MEVIDTGLIRSDLGLRREIKYAFPESDMVDELRHLLSASCKRVIYNRPVSEVRSIYFDDWQKRLLYANINGIGNRKKIRIRWYDQKHPSKDFYFEIKWRKSYITGKHRFQIKSPEDLGRIPYKEIVKKLLNILPNDHLGMFSLHSEPIVIVEYKREHFISPDEILRLTLDYDLMFYDQYGKKYPNLRFGIPKNNFVVIEGKGDPKVINNLKKLLYPFKPRATRCSKYAHGCNAIMICSEYF